MVCQIETGLNLAALEPGHDLGEHISTIVNRIDRHNKHRKVGQIINRSNLVTISPIETLSRPRSHTRELPTCTNTRPNLIQIPTLTTKSVSNHTCKLAVTNAQSVCNKTNEIYDFISDTTPDILLITETWIKDNSSYVCDQITPDGYTIVHNPRIGNKRGGGTAILCRSSYKPKSSNIAEFQTFESTSVNINLPNANARLACIYRPPGVPTTQFYDEFTTFLEAISLDNNRIIIAGDFNIHVDNASDPTTKKLLHVLDTFGLTQHVKFGTHTSGHCLDLVITRHDDPVVSSTAMGPLLSDHFTVLCDLNLGGSDFEKKRIYTRNIKDIDTTAFKQDIKTKLAAIDTKNPDLNCIVNAFNASLLSVLDQHAPAKCKLVTQKPRSPWMNEDIRCAKRARRRAENRLSASNTSENRELYKRAKNHVSKLIDIAKKDHYQREKTKKNARTLKPYSMLLMRLRVIQKHLSILKQNRT